MEEHERRRICRQAVDDMEKALQERTRYQADLKKAQRDLEELEIDLADAKVKLQRVNSLPIPSRPGGGPLGTGLGLAAEIARQRQIAQLEGQIARLDLDIRVTGRRVEDAAASLRDANDDLENAGVRHRRFGCDDVAPRSLVRP